VVLWPPRRAGLLLLLLGAGFTPALEIVLVQQEALPLGRRHPAAVRT